MKSLHLTNSNVVLGIIATFKKGLYVYNLGGFK